MRTQKIKVPEGPKIWMEKFKFEDSTKSGHRQFKIPRIWRGFIKPGCPS